MSDDKTMKAKKVLKDILAYKDNIPSTLSGRGDDYYFAVREVQLIHEKEGEEVALSHILKSSEWLGTENIEWRYV